MGLAQTLRSFDLLSAWREWPAARKAYLSRGLTIGEPITRKSALSEETLGTGTQKVTQAIQVFIRCGDDQQAIQRLTALRAQGASLEPEAALNELRNRRAAFRALEQVLPSLIRSSDRIQAYQTWLEALPAIDVRPFLSGLAAEGVAVPRNLNPLVRIPQCRAMQVWTNLFDATDGFSAPPTEIADRMQTTPQDSGISLSLAGTHLPVLAQAVRTFADAEHQRAALVELLQVMDKHAKSGLWPRWVEDKVVVQNGNVEVSLPVPRT